MKLASEHGGKLSHTIDVLIRSFPSLIGKPGASPWDALILDRWAASGIPSHGERVAAQFVLGVWDPRANWSCGQFDVFEAMRIWDCKHQAAFLEWVSRPWHL